MIVITKGFRPFGVAVAVVLILALNTYPTHAQWRLNGPFNKFSVEIHTGVDFPITPGVAEGQLRDYTSFLSTQAGVRYMITDVLGIRPVYGFHRFRGSGDPQTPGGFTVHRVGLDGVVNMAPLFPPGNFRNPRKFNALLHIGGSFGFGALPKSHRFVDDLLVGTFGLTPQYRISRNLALTLDLSGHAGVSQNYGFDGHPIERSGHRLLPNTFFLTGSVGLQVYLGKYLNHMDWK